MKKTAAKRKIAMIASESNPLVKTGGLADVVFSLSKALRAQREDVRIVIPFYPQVWGKLHEAPKQVARVEVRMNWRNNAANVFLAKLGGVPFYLIQNQQYFERDAVYGYDDDGERFAFFAQAALKALEAVGFAPDIVHVHDWQAAMVPCLLKAGHLDFFASTKTVLTIHNPAFKGAMDPDALYDLFNLPLSLYENGSVRLDGRFSTLKAGIAYADKITTVSPTHRNELLTQDGGWGLDGVLRYRQDDFCGFLNGIDYDEWNPKKDSKIPMPYDADSFAKGKEEAKRALFAKTYLRDHGGPTFGLVSRLTFQKGVDLVRDIMPKLLEQGAHFLCLGSGERMLEQDMENLRSRYPSQVALYIGYNDLRAHEIYAASDFFLMPSSFEPCGISQLIAQRYGSLPIVRYTGGLRDTVEGYVGWNQGTATGIGFESYDYYGIDWATSMAMGVYRNKPAFEQMVRNAMNKDNSWDHSASLYRGLYETLAPLR